MDGRTPRLASIALATAALALGWLLAGGRGHVEAGAGSRSGQSASVAGPVKVESGGAIQFGMGKIQAPLDAVYWIDYRGAPAVRIDPLVAEDGQGRPAPPRILRARPRRRLRAQARRPAELPDAVGVARRDGRRVVALDRDRGDVEADRRLPGDAPRRTASTAGRSSTGSSSRPTAPRRWPRPGPRGEPIGVTGPVVIQQAPDGTQVPLDAVYWIDSDRDRPCTRSSPRCSGRPGSRGC